jgi:hypothetical protein
MELSGRAVVHEDRAQGHKQGQRQGVHHHPAPHSQSLPSPPVVPHDPLQAKEIAHTSLTHCQCPKPCIPCILSCICQIRKNAFPNSDKYLNIF